MERLSLARPVGAGCRPGGTGLSWAWPQPVGQQEKGVELVRRAVAPSTRLCPPCSGSSPLGLLHTHVGSLHADDEDSDYHQEPYKESYKDRRRRAHTQAEQKRRDAIKVTREAACAVRAQRLAGSRGPAAPCALLFSAPSPFFCCCVCPPQTQVCCWEPPWLWLAAWWELGFDTF